VLPIAVLPIAVLPAILLVLKLSIPLIGCHRLARIYQIMLNTGLEPVTFGS